FEHLPYHQSDLHAAQPIYEELPGWHVDLSEATEPRHLPPAAHRYLDLLEAQVGVPIRLVGTGPGRDQFVHRRDLAMRVCVVGSWGRGDALGIVFGGTAAV